MENSFELLEDRIRKAVELVKRLRKENRDLQDEIQKARPRLHELEKKVEAAEKHRGAAGADAAKLEGLTRELKELRHEREEIRRRIAKLVQALDALE
jgi:predicted RNase H-like nuclease (RuvC/YqgF family)